MASGLWCVLVSENAPKAATPERMAQALQVESISVANVAPRVDKMVA